MLKDVLESPSNLDMVMQIVFVAIMPYKKQNVLLLVDELTKCKGKVIPLWGVHALNDVQEPI